MKIIVFLFVFISVVFAETISIPTDATCLIRNFKVYQAPAWASTIKVRSGQIIYFSSPKSMFEFYFQPGRWPEFQVKYESDMQIDVTDYQTLEKIPAKEAYYVYGSNQTGPSGDDLPAFANKESAEAFAKKNNGKKVLDFAGVSDGLINLLNNRLC